MTGATSTTVSKQALLFDVEHSHALLGGATYALLHKSPVPLVPAN
jgi:hypothetical protein